MRDVVFWLYLINAVTLIVHEIDSAYWKEWELFRLPGGLAGFLLLHFPLIFLVLYGLVLVDRGVLAGLVLSLLLGLGGIFAFSIHTYFIRRGREEFKAPVSLAILWITLIVSLAQLGVTLAILTAS
ncbi:MAG: hypothetical protein MAG451_00446 [Anaerolineales bacterium]|nr:hypothetical protein [Anaerolineales bacterium]